LISAVLLAHGGAVRLGQETVFKPKDVAERRGGERKRKEDKSERGGRRRRPRSGRKRGRESTMAPMVYLAPNFIENKQLVATCLGANSCAFFLAPTLFKVQ